MKRLTVEVSGISVCPPYKGYVVILKEQNGQRWLPIFIGAAEAHNISLLVHGLNFVRPLTYDLFHSLLDAAGAAVEYIAVTDLRDNTFFAEVSLKSRGGISAIDARPSDAIALAIKTGAPIYVHEHVMDEAGLIGDEKPDNEARVRVLNQQLNEAVEQEAYEDAARIRDMIREIELNSGSQD